MNSSMYDVLRPCQSLIYSIFRKTSVVAVLRERLRERLGTPPEPGGERERTGDSLRHQERETETQDQGGHLHLQGRQK